MFISSTWKLFQQFASELACFRDVSDVGISLYKYGGCVITSSTDSQNWPELDRRDEVRYVTNWKNITLALIRFSCLFWFSISNSISMAILRNYQSPCSPCVIYSPPFLLILLILLTDRKKTIKTNTNEIVSSILVELQFRFST